VKPHQNRKDVTITYAFKERSGDLIQLDDIVEYRAKTDPPTSKRSTVIGVDTLLAPSCPGGVGSRFKWRGKGWLMIASSRWQILGCQCQPLDSATPGTSTPEWALTYFAKTLFTPAGMDIYARTPEGLPDVLLQAIISKAKALGGEVGNMAHQFFEVERSPLVVARGTVA